MDVHVTDIVIQNLNGKPCNTKFLTGAQCGSAWARLWCSFGAFSESAVRQLRLHVLAAVSPPCPPAGLPPFLHGTCHSSAALNPLPNLPPPLCAPAVKRALAPTPF